MEKKICLSIEQMQKLKELGVNIKDASLVKVFYDEDGIELAPSLFNKEETAWWDDENECWVTSFYTEVHDAETGNYDHSCREEYATFTLHDMLELMPVYIDNSLYSLELSFDEIAFTDEPVYTLQYVDLVRNVIKYSVEKDNLLDATFDMLVWLAENGYLKKEARN